GDGGRGGIGGARATIALMGVGRNMAFSCTIVLRGCYNTTVGPVPRYYSWDSYIAIPLVVFFQKKRCYMEGSGEFAGRLKELRAKAGLTQKELADKARVTLRAVSHWEQGLRSPSWDAVQKLAAALEVPFTEFQGKPAKPAKQAGPGRPRKKG